MASGLAEQMACNGPGSSGKQAKHELDISNTTFGLKKAGRSLQGPSGFSVINSRSTSQRD
jgi:hypothetical protein